jgi:hypothetical protein
MTQPKSNCYSRRWFEFFHIGIAEARTTQEIDFVCACAPLPGFRKVVDVLRNGAACTSPFQPR